MNRASGFSLLELLFAVALLGALAAIGIQSYASYKSKALTAQAIYDLSLIAVRIHHYYLDERDYPATLADLGSGIPDDPWGRPYRYLAIDTLPPPVIGKLRKDKNLNPLNSDYDLYSVGPDGETQLQLTAKKARDDIVRAGNGRFIGEAADH